MRILVTGGSGYLGSHLISNLLRNSDFEIINLDLNFNPNIEYEGRVIYLEGDVRDFDFVREKIDELKPKVIFHLAAKKSVQDSFRHPHEYLETNASSTWNLANSALQNGVRKFVFISSAAVYGVPIGAKITEESQTRPSSPYGESKLMAERGLIQMFEGQHDKLLVIRLFNLFGYDSNLFFRNDLLTGENLQSYIARSITSGERFIVFKSETETIDGSNMRDYIHPADAAEALVQLSNVLNPHMNVLNLGTGNALSVLEILKATEKSRSSAINFDWRASRVGDPGYSVSNTDQLKSLIDWQPRYSEIDSLVEFFKML
jgi:UDP-glucose 4-epimerase